MLAASLAACSGPPRSAPSPEPNRAVPTTVRRRPASLRHQRAVRRPERDRPRHAPGGGDGPAGQAAARDPAQPGRIDAVRRAQRLAVRAARRGRKQAPAARPIRGRHRRRGRAHPQADAGDPGGHGSGAALLEPGRHADVRVQRGRGHRERRGDRGRARGGGGEGGRRARGRRDAARRRRGVRHLGGGGRGFRDRRRKPRGPAQVLRPRLGRARSLSCPMASEPT